jgi:glutathione S-transferase
MMTLYWWPRTRALRAIWMLEEAGAEYRRVPIDIFAGAQNSDAFRRINPMMKLPALTDGEATVAESGALCAYVADRVPEAGLAPPIGDPRRGRYLQWLFFSGNCIEPAFLQIVLKLELSPSQAGWGSADRVFNVIEDALRPGPWLLGAEFSAADVVIGSDLRFAVDVFKIVPPRPAFRDYIDRCTARPAFQRALAIEDAGP